MTRDNLSGIGTSRSISHFFFFFFCFFFFFTALGSDDEVRHLKLSEAVRLALEQNRALKIARFKVKENEHRKEGFAQLIRFITINPTRSISANCRKLSIPPGAFGTATGRAHSQRKYDAATGQKTFISSGT